MDDARMATLDLPPDELTALLDRALEVARSELDATRRGPIFSEPPSSGRVERLFEGRRELPLDGADAEGVVAEAAAVLEAGRRTAPTFFGYVLSPPSPVGVAADLLASAADQNLTAWRSAPAATEVERLAVRWLAEFVGLGEDAAGILVGGGSAANLNGMILALRDQTETDADRRTLVAYTSMEAHFSIAKAAAVLGVQLRRVAVDGDHRLDLSALAAALEADRVGGLEPFCIVGTAGTVATGAVDPLDSLADVAERERLWLHVDGAYGGFAAADPSSRALFAGIERVDSLAVDPHKWLYAPIDCGALLVRDPAVTGRAFGEQSGDYVRVLGGGDAESFVWWDHGLELTRRFRALKVWMTFRYYGAQRLAASIAEDIDMAQHMAELVDADGELELLAPRGLSVCCFRHVPPAVAKSALDAHNERLLAELQRGGRVYLSNATVGGRFALRACVTNFRTTRGDVERTVDAVRELGRALASPRPAEPPPHPSPGG